MIKNKFDEELEKIKKFEKFLDGITSISLLDEKDLFEYSKMVYEVQNILSLISSIPNEQKPNVLEWDDVVSRLWRKLFSRSDDIDRYTFSDIWLKVLMETDCEERILRTASGFLASCRNFSLFDEGIERGEEIRKRFKNSKNAPYANFLNTLGSIYHCKKDFNQAELLFKEALEIAKELPDEEILKWVGITKDGFIAQEKLNIASNYTTMAFLSSGASRNEYLEKAKEMVKEISLMELLESAISFLLIVKAEIAILQERENETINYLEEVEKRTKEGKTYYAYSLLTTVLRLYARLYYLKGDYKNSYQYIRKALKNVSVKTYPAEDIFVLEDALMIIRKLYEGKSVKEEVVKDLVLLLEDKDWYTGGSHSRKVAVLSLKIGHQLKMEGSFDIDLLQLEMAGLVHDIGKLKIPWSLLNKIAPITPKEREILKLHSKFGKEILEEIGLYKCANIVYQHHETMDMKGYPEGKKPTIESSIVGICDVFDASTTENRRYKKPKSTEEALDEITSLSNIKYHKDAVRGLNFIFGREV